MVKAMNIKPECYYINFNSVNWISLIIIHFNCILLQKDIEFGYNKSDLKYVTT